MRAAFLHGFSGQAILSVAVVHAVLLPLVTTGWINAYAYGIAALALSCAACCCLDGGWRARVAGLRTR